MDIFAHGLWTSAAYQAVNLKRKNKLNVLYGAFWGVFPDLLSFTPLFFWIFWNTLIEGNNVLRGPEFNEPAIHDGLFITKLTNALYSMSHSLFVFAVIFIVVIAVRKFIMRKAQYVPWVLGGWLLHILIDIPTHSYSFYPTPFLWPISSFKFNGYAWSHSGFLLINYALLVITYLAIYFIRKSKPVIKKYVSKKH